MLTGLEVISIAAAFVAVSVPLVALIVPPLFVASNAGWPVAGEILNCPNEMLPEFAFMNTPAPPDPLTVVLPKLKTVEFVSISIPILPGFVIEVVVELSVPLLVPSTRIAGIEGGPVVDERDVKPAFSIIPLISSS